MRRLRVRFDSKLTQAIAELASRHGMSKANVVHAAISTYKAISDLDLHSLSDKSRPQPRFSERLQTMAQSDLSASADQSEKTMAVEATVGAATIRAINDMMNDMIKNKTHSQVESTSMNTENIEGTQE